MRFMVGDLALNFGVAMIVKRKMKYADVKEKICA